MKFPTVHGYIERRILINYQVEPDVASHLIPTPFRPKLYNGKAIGGICLIRLKSIKPKGMPDLIGIASENGAHRFAVEWDDNESTKQGVYIPRRDTSSSINALAGGTIFPGVHHRAKFTVNEADGNYKIGFVSADNTQVAIEAQETDQYSPLSIFGSLDNVSAFFKEGCTGYSPNGNGFDGLTLQTYNWQVSPLNVLNVQSSYFEDEKLFPKGSVIFDNALLMTNIEHEWHNADSKQFLQMR